ncbi:MAG: M48 family metallopeptidase [Sulfuricaulis sp.]
MTKKKLSNILPVISLLLVPCQSGADLLESIDKGLGTTADAISQYDRITGKRTPNMVSRQKQIEDGNAPIDKIINEADNKNIPYNEKLDPEAFKTVNEIFHRVHAVSHMRDEQWRVFLIPDQSFNAFVTGGTYIVVHIGLVIQLKGNPDEIAGVIGHEIAHVAANHITEQQAHLVLGMLSRSQSAKRESYKSAYTHDGEAEADKVGILYAALAGYDPFAASRVWARKFEQSGNERLYIHDHPVSSERAASTLRIAQQVKQYSMPGQQNPNFATLLDNNVLWQKQQVGSSSGGGSGTAAFLDTVLSTALRNKQAKVEEQRQLRHINLVKSINRLVGPYSAQALSENSIRISFRYQGTTFQFRRLVLALIAPNTEGQPLKMVNIFSNSRLRAGNYTADFAHEKLNTRLVKESDLHFYIDDAE